MSKVLARVPKDPLKMHGLSLPTKSAGTELGLDTLSLPALTKLGRRITLSKAASNQTNSQSKSSHRLSHSSHCQCIGEKHSANQKACSPTVSCWPGRHSLCLETIERSMQNLYMSQAVDLKPLQGGC